MRALILAFSLALSGALCGDLSEAVLQRREALQTAAAEGPGAVPTLSAGLADPNPIVRRSAARLLSRVHPLPVEALALALKNNDTLVRRFALDCLTRAPGIDPLPHLGTALHDPAAALRLAAVQRLIAIAPRSAPVTKLIQVACGDPDDTVARTASQALWNFHRDVKRLSERADWDYDVRVTQSIPLPLDAWRFRTDPRSEGHLQEWFEPGFDDTQWRRIPIGQAWQKAGVDYTGVSWYRRDLQVPEKPDLNAVEIHFEGVDESAWVWVNGIYVGSHDIGPAGWDQPFSLDVTKEITWGGSNQITVRAMSTQGNGGIWKPVSLQVLK